MPKILDHAELRPVTNRSGYVADYKVYRYTDGVRLIGIKQYGDDSSRELVWVIVKDGQAFIMQDPPSSTRGLFLTYFEACNPCPEVFATGEDWEAFLLALQELKDECMLTDIRLVEVLKARQSV